MFCHLCRLCRRSRLKINTELRIINTSLRSTEKCVTIDSIGRASEEKSGGSKMYKSENSEKLKNFSMFCEHGNSYLGLYCVLM